MQRDREAAAQHALAAGEGDRLGVAAARLETITAARSALEALTRVTTALTALEDSMQQPLTAALQIAVFSQKRGLLSANGSPNSRVSHFFKEVTARNDDPYIRQPTLELARNGGTPATTVRAISPIFDNSNLLFPARWHVYAPLSQSPDA